MTTIAWDGRTLAADRLFICSGLKSRGRKLWRCGAYVYGGAGATGELLGIARWLTAGANPDDAPNTEEGGCWGLAIRLRDGRGYKVQGKRVALVPFRGPSADGSGRDFAIAAMHLGASAREAVNLAAHFDASTGKGVDEIHIRAGRPRSPRR